MSRTNKKHIVIKDSKPKCNVHNKLFRRINKNLINQGKEPKLQKEVFDQWEVCDYRQYKRIA